MVTSRIKAGICVDIGGKMTTCTTVTTTNPFLGASVSSLLSCGLLSYRWISVWYAVTGYIYLMLIAIPDSLMVLPSTLSPFSHALSSHEVNKMGDPFSTHLGDMSFVSHLEHLLGRELRPRKSGRKPKKSDN
jgi:hypothetical protein